MKAGRTGRYFPCGNCSPVKRRIVAGGTDSCHGTCPRQQRDVRAVLEERCQGVERDEVHSVVQVDVAGPGAITSCLGSAASCHARSLNSREWLDRR